MQPLDLNPEANWRKRFSASNVLWALVASRNPQRGLICSNQDGIYQLYAWDIPTNELTQLTYEAAGKIMGMISADGESIYYLKDEGGNMIGHYVRLPFAGGEAQDISPDLPQYSSSRLTQNHMGGTTSFSTAGEDGYRIYIQHGEPPPTVLYHSPGITRGPVLSSDGRIAALGSSERAKGLNFSILALYTQNAQPINELYDEDASLAHMIFSPIAGDARLVATSNRSGFERPFLWDAASGERVFLQLDEVPGSIHPCAWSPDAEQLLLCRIHEAQYQLYRYDVNAHHVTRLDHPVGTLGVFFDGFFAPNGEIWTTWEDSANPSSLIALDEKSGQLKRVVLQADAVPPGKAFRSVSFPSENGDLIQGWLAVPDGEGPFPTVLETHGGPTWVMSSLFSPNAQCWLDHGFAFLSLNYHGSTTFGKQFEESIYRNLGDLEVQDMSAAYHWLVKNKIARPDAVFLTGVSYGGYLTLQALGRCPDLWAGGMAEVAVADWKTAYEDEADSMKALDHAFFGGTPEEVPEAYRKSSPLTYAEHVRAPILVMNGENDSTCPPRQMKLYEEKLRSLGKLIEVHWFNAGHGAFDTQQQIKHQEWKLKFAYRVLG